MTTNLQRLALLLVGCIALAFVLLASGCQAEGVVPLSAEPDRSGASVTQPPTPEVRGVRRVPRNARPGGNAFSPGAQGQSPATAGTPAPSAPLSLGLTDALQAQLDQQYGAALDAYGVVVEYLPSGEQFAFQPDRQFPSASVYKLPLAVEVLRRAERGEVALDQRIRILDTDVEEEEPEGGLAAGDEVTLLEGLQAMLGVSSNAAAHAVLRVLSRDAVNLGFLSIGLPDTRVPSDSAEAGNNLFASSTASDVAVTTASDVASLLRGIARGGLLSPAQQTVLRDLLSAPQPFDPLADALPPGVAVLAKTGNLADASNFAGLVLTPAGPFLVAVLDEGVDPGDARGLIAQVARTAFAVVSR